jgi:hypothetical protein
MTGTSIIQASSKPPHVIRTMPNSDSAGSFDESAHGTVIITAPSWWGMLPVQLGEPRAAALLA